MCTSHKDNKSFNSTQRNVNNDKDFFKTVKQTIQISGMYPIFNIGRVGKVLNMLYYVFYDLVQLHMLLLLFWNLTTKSEGDVSRIAFLLVSLVPYMNAVLFDCYFQMRTHLVDRLFSIAQREFHYSSAPGPYFESMESSLKLVRFIAISLTVVTGITAHQWTVIPLFINGVNGTRLLPVPIEYPFDVQTSPRYEAAYTFQAIAQMMMAVEYGGIGCLYAAFSILIGNQFDILCCGVRNASLSRLAVRNVGGRHEDDELQVGGKNNGIVDYSLYGSEKEFIEDMKVCVEHHLALKMLCRSLDELYRPILLFMLSGIMLMMCTSLYSVTDKFELPTLEYTFVSVLHCTVFCYFGHNISMKSQTVAEAAYTSVWWRHSRESRRMATLMMQHSQKPIVLTAGGIIILNLGTFLEIVRSAFSFFTLLRNLKEQQN